MQDSEIASQNHSDKRFVNMVKKHNYAIAKITNNFSFNEKTQLSLKNIDQKNKVLVKYKVIFEKNSSSYLSNHETF